MYEQKEKQSKLYAHCIFSLYEIILYGNISSKNKQIWNEWFDQHHQYYAIATRYYGIFSKHIKWSMNVFNSYVNRSQNHSWRQSMPNALIMWYSWFFVVAPSLNIYLIFYSFPLSVDKFTEILLISFIDPFYAFHNIEFLSGRQCIFRNHYLWNCDIRWM